MEARASIPPIGTPEGLRSAAGTVNLKKMAGLFTLVNFGSHWR
jgi:hypothetical protein